MKKTVLLGILLVLVLVGCNQPVVNMELDGMDAVKNGAGFIPAWDPQVMYAPGDIAQVSWKGYVYENSGYYSHNGIEPSPETMDIWRPVGPYSYYTEAPAVTLTTEEWFLKIENSGGVDITCVMLTIAGTIVNSERVSITTVGFGLREEYYIAVDANGQFSETIMYRGIASVPTAPFTESTTLTAVNGAGVNEVVLTSPPLNTAQATVVPVVTPTSTYTPCPCVTVTPTVTVTSTPHIPNEWDPAMAYNGGDLVTYGYSVWRARWWTQGEEPSRSEWGPWEWQYDYVIPPITPTPDLTITPTPTVEPTLEITATPTNTVSPTPEATPTATTGTGGDAWDPAKVYVGGDIIVCPDGRIFRAKWWTTGGDNPCDNPDLWGPWEQIN